MTRKKPVDSVLPASFRDPDGFLFTIKNQLYRQINLSYKEDYELLVGSGLYQKLTSEQLLISHSEVSVKSPSPANAWKIIKPEPVEFISYPYEWSFSQLKDAALLTLNLQKTAVGKGMSLKDATAYNVQFHNGKPVFIDSLSFEKYVENKPWIAYGQFCRHFLAPLLLMYYKKPDLNRLMRLYLDGIPLDLASVLLPWFTRLKFSILSHIHLHAKSSKHYADKGANQRTFRFSKHSMLALVDNLESLIKKLNWEPAKTEWANYTENNNYTEISHEHKKKLITEYLKKTKPVNVWDLGANTGVFSYLAAEQGIRTISFDVDEAAVEKNYLQCKKSGETKILPLLTDLTNPSPAQGWDNTERLSFTERGPAGMVFALALVHHLAIANNIPLERIAVFLQNLCQYLIIEFVPKEDSQVKRLLASREDIFPGYTRENFEKVFKSYFVIQNITDISDSVRTLYLMKAKN